MLSARVCGVLLLTSVAACGGGGADDAAGGKGGTSGSGAAGASSGGKVGTGTGGTGTGGRASGGAAGGGALGGSSAGGTAGTSARGGTSGGGGRGGMQSAGGAGGAGAAPAAGMGAGGESGSSNAGGSGMSGSAGEPSGEPGVRIVGRTEAGTDGLRFSWPGVSFHARFSGTQASIQLSDAANANEFEVIVDGAPTSTITTTSGQTSYPVATGLGDGEHDVLVWRRTEAYYNPTEFLGFGGFSAGGALLPPPAPLPHRIEAIGDSITVGYGNEGMPGCQADTTNENNYLAYASVAARALHADLVTIAWSGIGAYRNYGETGPSADAMPARYDRAVPTESNSTWDFSQFEPEAVVINLGTNDYSTHGDPGQPFIDAYLGLVQHVRSKYPDAYIFCLIQQSESKANIDTVVSTLKGDGETAIEAFDINVSSGGSGCDGHPDVAKDQAMGDKLAAELATVLGW